MARTRFHSAPLPGPFGVEVSRVDLPRLSDDDVRALLLMLYANRIMVVRTGGLSKSDYVAFARRIGEPITLSDDVDHPEIAEMTNIGVDSRTQGRGAAHWHSDQSFRKAGASVTMLYSVRSPMEGGETRFCDLAAAWEALPSDMKARIDGLQVEHRHGVSVAARPGDHVPIAPPNWDQRHTVVHPLVRQHPVTGQTSLYAITGTSQGIKDMPQDEATALLNELCEHAFREPFLNQHAHSVHDILMWDNPTTMHSASPIGAATCDADTRVIRRISLKGYPPVFHGGSGPHSGLR
jgi:taurine dioxygenase